MLNTIDILGYPVIDATPEEVAKEVADSLSADRPLNATFLNPHSVAVARRDGEFAAAVRDSDLVFCDGAGLALACRLLNRRAVRRIYGYEFFIALSHELSRRQAARVLFLGGSESMMAELVARYRRDFPGITEVGSICPPYRPAFTAADIDGMAAQIAAFRPDVLWVGLGSPKQEKVMHALRRRPGVPCTAAIGAVFDFYTGRISHAPAWIRAAGLQWLHRLLLEPRRLWRRTLISGPLFALEVLRGLRRPATPSAER